MATDKGNKKLLESLHANLKHQKEASRLLEVAASKCKATQGAPVLETYNSCSDALEDVKKENG